MADLFLNDRDGYSDLCVINGDLAVCDDDSDVVQHAINACKTKVGEIPFHPEYGNTARGNRMKYLQTYLDVVEEGCTNVILLDDEVADVLELNATLNTDDRTVCDVQFKLLTVDGRELDSNCSIELR